MGRRDFLRSLLVGAVGTVALTRLPEIAAELAEYGTYTGFRFVDLQAAAERLAENTVEEEAGNWIVICHPDLDIEAELRGLPPPDSTVNLARGEIGHINFPLRFYNPETKESGLWPPPRRGAQWKHEQRPYHTRFA